MRAGTRRARADAAGRRDADHGRAARAVSATARRRRAGGRAVLRQGSGRMMRARTARRRRRDRRLVADRRPSWPRDRPRPSGRRSTTAALKADVDAFFDREVASHFLQIPADGPLPERVHGALTTGEFSWGTFVRALAAYADTRSTRMVGGRDVVPLDRPRRRDRIGERQQGLRAALCRARAAALRRRPVEERAVAVVVRRRSPQVESAARSDALLQSEDAPGDRSAGKLPGRRVTRRHAVVPDGRDHRSRLRRCAARSRGGTIHERRALRR